MTVAALMLLGATAVGLLVAFGAVKELYRGVHELRRYAGYVDRPRPLDVNTQIAISILDIPGAQDPDLVERAMVLILSDRCLTCDDILRQASVSSPDGLILLVNGRTVESVDRWLARYGMARSDRILHDPYGLMAMQLGIAISPAAVRVDHDHPVEAFTVPSARQLDRALAWLREPTGTMSRRRT